MTETELDAANAAAHEAMIADAKARIADNERRQATRQTHIDHGLAAYKLVKSQSIFKAKPS